MLIPQLALIMRQQEPVSTLAEKCFAEAQGILAEAGPPTWRLVTKMPKRPLMGECQYSPGDAGPLVKVVLRRRLMLSGSYKP